MASSCCDAGEENISFMEKHQHEKEKYQKKSVEYCKKNRLELKKKNSFDFIAGLTEDKVRKGCAVSGISNNYVQ